MSEAESDGKQNPPKGLVAETMDLLKDKGVQKLIAIVVVALVVALLILFGLVIFFLRPDSVEITTKAGTIAIKTGSTENTVLMLSAAGSRENNLPWTGTGIFVKSSDKVEIQASGLVHTNLNKLIAVGQTDRKQVPSWIDPEGSSREEERDWDDKRKDYKLMPDNEGAHYGYGMLLAAIRSEQGEVLQETAVGKEGVFNAEKDGELILAVNDLILNSSARNIYALPLLNNYSYYRNKVEEEDKLKEGNAISPTNKTLNEKIREEYQKRLRAWEDIDRNNNWLVWYEDNVGAFSVSVKVN